MAARFEDSFDRLVDHFIAEALDLLPTELHKEIVIGAFGLRDGIYQSSQDMGEALGISQRQVTRLLANSLQTIKRAQLDGRLRVGDMG